ncbi:MAG: L-rhamnose mutarotase [Caulobacteraceae bacterium]|nr:L-rhamnose mutarotase [Caulobacteraceae bacterium]
MATHCLFLDLVDDAELIAAYRHWHRPGGIPEEVAAAIRAAGIEEMEIFQRDDRLVMIMRTAPGFDPAAKAAADAANPAVVAWERLMDRFQKPLPSARHGEKWLSATRIFALSEQT